MFNLKKYSQIESAPQGGLDVIEDANESLSLQIENEGIADPTEITNDVDTDELVLTPEESRAVENLAAQQAWMQMIETAKQYKGNGIDVSGILNSDPDFIDLRDKVNAFDVRSFNFDANIKTKVEQAAANNDEYANIVSTFERKAREAFDLLKERQDIMNVAAFNLSKTKKAQLNNQSLFPVIDAADLANKLFESLLSNDEATFANASNEVLSQFKGDIQEQDVKDILDRFWNLDARQDQEQAMELFGLLYELLPGNLKQTEPTMGNNNPKGIIKFNLSDHVLNNKEHQAKTEFLDGLRKDANSGGMIKTAADQFGQQYVLYGPTEKRICPKLRGKGGGQPGSGDVVSEYICRHHCLDGIVIDDNKTVCGEALWRAHTMDKFSREYVNENGDIEGGYLNKRFEINRNTPEENKMRLKPGETRKPRPAEWGSLESRMQAMRQAQGEERGYTPTNTGDAFEWCCDSDQNNVEQTQTERDRREESMGHELVNYTKKDKQENDPKIASKGFNLRKYKTAQFDPHEEKIMQDEIITWIGRELGPTVLEAYLEGRISEQEMQAAANNPQVAMSLKQKFEHGIPNQPRTANNKVKSFNLSKSKTAKKGVDYKGEHYDTNPWAVCHTTVDKDEDPEKYERCVKDVKEKSKSSGFNSKGILIRSAKRKNAKKYAKALLAQYGVSTAFNLKRTKKAQVPSFEQERYNFSEGEERLRAMSDESLLYTLKDVLETIEIQEAANKDPNSGMVTPKLGYYWDEFHTIIKVLNERGVKVSKADLEKLGQGANVPIPDDGTPIEPVENPIRKSKNMPSEDIEAQMIAEDLLDWWQNNDDHNWVTNPNEILQRMMEKAPQMMQEYSDSSYELMDAKAPQNQWGRVESERLLLIEAKLQKMLNIPEKQVWEGTFGDFIKGLDPNNSEELKKKVNR